MWRAQSATVCSDIFLFYQSYEKTTEEIQKQLDDVDKKIHIQIQENQKLNMEVASLSVDVNEQQLLQGLELESRQTEALKQRWGLSLDGIRLLLWKVYWLLKGFYLVTVLKVT